MDAPKYDKLLRLLHSAKLTLAANAGELSPADLRIRCLVNITAKETERALLETRAAGRSRSYDGARTNEDGAISVPPVSQSTAPL